MRVPSILTRAYLSKAFALLAAATLLAAVARPAAAEDWPTRPITLVLNFAPGGLIDFIGRPIAQHLSEVFGQNVVVENKVGGGGAVGHVAVARAAPDGYTLLLTAVGPAVFRPLFDKAVGYDMEKDFTPIILATDSPNVLIASPKLGLNSVKDLLAYAAKNQNRLTVAHSGPGTVGHLCSVAFASEAHIDASFIAYRGAAPMVSDLVGGQIDIGFPTYGPAVDAAKILAVTTEARVDFLPGVPTMKENGLDVIGSTWYAIYAPAGVPAEIVKKINAAVNDFLRKPETKAKFAKGGASVLAGTPEQLRERVARETAKWAPIIARFKIGADK